MLFSSISVHSSGRDLQGHPVHTGTLRSRKGQVSSRVSQQNRGQARTGTQSPCPEQGCADCPPSLPVSLVSFDHRHTQHWLLEQVLSSEIPSSLDTSLGKIHLDSLSLFS